MNDEPKRDRSPNYPKLTLEAAIALVGKLHKELGKAKVKREVAIKALGYSGINGASLTTLGAISQYGLIDQDRGSGVSVSPMAVEILHPTNATQSQNAIITAALTPKVFNVLYTEGLHRASEQTLANHLIQNAFTPDGAAKAAAVFLSNISFANLSNESMMGPSDAKKDQIKKSLESGTFSMHPVSRQIIADEAKVRDEKTRPTESVLATYTAPLKFCDATITFTGKKLTADDFESLKKFVEFAKDSYTARQQQEPQFVTGPVESESR